MKLYSRYIGFVYLKYVFILFIALECFYTGVDFLTNDNTPQSANLALLYAVFTAAGAVQYTLPLALIFAMIIAFFGMIKNNELISFYSFGISKFEVIKAPFIISIIITIFYIYLNTTPFAYANEYKGNLENFNAIGRISSGIFLKYEDKYLYINALNSSEKAAANVRIFQLKDDKIVRASSVKKASYDDKKWTFYDENATVLPAELKLGAKGLSYENRDKFEDLYNFKPE
ncbi:MAG: LptF/LptG family permease, partial [Campylobacter sp.]|nr:LptF/LptG family permease [Campylobacter sp.]